MVADAEKDFYFFQKKFQEPKYKEKQKNILKKNKVFKKGSLLSQEEFFLTKQTKLSVTIRYSSFG